MKTSGLFKRILIGLIFTIGILVRVFQFPANPAGFNQDEASAAYEAYSLSETGKDRWGNEWPAYFPSWGSGQNVLLSYLSIPIVKAFGPSIFSARLVSLLCGLLSMPLFYFSIRPLGRYAALLGLFLVAVSPWHFMLSRWALESNLLPFFMLMGCAMISRALISNERKWIVPSLIPFALALYAYGTSALVLPVFFGILLLSFYKTVHQHITYWIYSVGLFLITSFPFLIFFAENYILKENLEWSDNLFFSTPLLPSTRISQINAVSWSDTVTGNFKFMCSGFDDGAVYSLLPGFPLLLSFIVPLGIIGLLYFAYNLVRKSKTILSQPKAKVLLVFFAWAVASLTLFFSFQLNVNRFNHFYFPCIVLAVWLISTFSSHITNALIKNAIRLAVVGWFVVEGGLAIRSYFEEYPHNGIAYQFNDGLEDAFAAATWLQTEQIRITDQMPLPYVYTLFYSHYPPADFQSQADYVVEDGNYKVRRFGKYVFYDEFLARNKGYGYLSHKNEFPDNEHRQRTILFSNDSWEVGTIEVKP